MIHRRLLHLGVLSLIEMALIGMATIGMATISACSSTGTSKPVPTTAGPTSAAPTTDDQTPLPPAQISLVAFSTSQAAYDRIIAAFQATPRGRNITFSESFGASGDQSRAVEAGLTADVVAFSLEPDIARLVKAKLVAPGWNAGPHRGIVSDSVVSLVVRKGNPKRISTWTDLTQTGVQVITPNPFTSGGARWNVMAAYGAASQVGKDDAAGIAYLGHLFDNVAVQDSSARTQLQTFVGGKGDVMIDYENDAIFAQKKGQDVDYVVPDQTLLIENPVAMTTTSKYPRQAQAFLDFLYSPTVQSIFADAGYRPVVQGVDAAHRFKTPPGLFTIGDLGGWTAMTAKFFDPTAGVMATIEGRLGVSVKP